MKRSEFKKLILEWNNKYQINETEENDIDRDLDDLGSSLGLSDDDYQDEPEDYERYHKSAEMLSVDQIVSALEADPDLMEQVMAELGIDSNDLPAEDGSRTPMDEDLID